MRLWALGVATFCLGFVHAAASAQTAGIAIDRFDVSERGSDWFVADSLDLRGDMRPALGFASTTRTGRSCCLRATALSAPRSSAGIGAERPIDTNDTPEGRRRNRRVEFHVQEHNGQRTEQP